MAYNVYSLPDVKAIAYHQDVGQCNLHGSGRGKMVITRSGDISSHTTTADGYVVVNRMASTNGAITIEIPQNSIADWFFRRWATYQKNLQNPSRVALGVITVQDTVAGLTITATGVSLQKIPDRSYDRTSSNVVWTFLAATITDQG